MLLVMMIMMLPIILEEGNNSDGKDTKRAGMSEICYFNCIYKSSPFQNNIKCYFFFFLCRQNSLRLFLKRIKISVFSLPAL